MFHLHILFLQFPYYAFNGLAKFVRSHCDFKLLLLSQLISAKHPSFSSCFNFVAFNSLTEVQPNNRMRCGSFITALVNSVLQRILDVFIDTSLKVPVIRYIYFVRIGFLIYALKKKRQNLG